MSADAPQQPQETPWYAAGVLDDDPETEAVCAAMRDLAEDWRDETTEFAAFARWVRGEALDPALFGDQVANDPTALSVAWYAWLGALDRQWRSDPPAQPSGAAGGVTVSPIAPPSAAASTPPAAPAGAPPFAPAGAGPSAEVA